jgi:hypothetical protein
LRHNANQIPNQIIKTICKTINQSDLIVWRNGIINRRGKNRELAYVSSSDEFTYELSFLAVQNTYLKIGLTTGLSQNFERF